MTYTGLPADFPAPVSGEILLCADDGFVLRADRAEDFLRQVFLGEIGALVLTDAEEAEEKPQGVSLEMRVAALEAAIQAGAQDTDAAAEEEGETGEVAE